MTQMSKMGPWFSPRAVGSGFGSRDQKTPPTHLVLKPKADKKKKAQERPNGYQPKPGEGAGVRTDLCPPIMHPSRVVTTPVEPWGGRESRCPTTLSPTLLPARAPRLSPAPVTPGTSEWSLKAHLLPPTSNCPSIHHPGSQHPRAKEPPSWAAPGARQDAVRPGIWLNCFQHTPTSRAHSQGTGSRQEQGGTGQAADSRRRPKDG